MHNLDHTKKLLENIGYKTYLVNLDELTYIRLIYLCNDFQESFWIYIEDTSYVFIDYEKQSGKKNFFQTEKELLEYIKKKYPLK